MNAKFGINLEIGSKKYSSQDENLRFTQIDVLQYFHACMCNSDMIHYHK